MERPRNRKHSIIDSLDPELKAATENLLLTGATYSEIVDYLSKQGVSLSVASVCRYARAFNANVQMLNIAQENFRRMTDEIAKYPGLDTTEAIIRIASQNVLNALANTPEDDWTNISPIKLLKETNGLIKAAAYKNRLDLQNKSDLDAGLEAIKGMAFDTMSRDRPDLYREVVKFLERQQKGN